MADENIQGLAPLSELDGFKVAEGDPDIRGWDVLASDGSKVGEVEDLVVDTAAMKVRYIDVELDDDRFENADDRHGMHAMAAWSKRCDGQKAAMDS